VVEHGLRNAYFAKRVVCVWSICITGRTSNLVAPPRHNWRYGDSGNRPATRGPAGAAMLGGSAAGYRQLGGGEQLALVGGDEQVALGWQREVEGRGDVLVGAAVGHRDRATEDSELVV